MPQSANHHYIPKALLKKFCFEPDSMYYISRNRKIPVVEVRDIESVFKKRHLNTYPHPNGTKDVGLEDFFAREFDCKIGNITSIFEESADIGTYSSRVSESNFMLFVQFFYNHMKRTPDFHGPIAKKANLPAVYQSAIDRFERRYRALTRQERSSLESVGKQQQILAQTRVAALSRQSPEILDILATKKLILAVPTKQTKQFVVASNPVVRFLNKPGALLTDDEIELWTTLTPRLAVGLSNAFGDLQVIKLEDVAVRRINSGLANQSSAFGAANFDLVESLAFPR